MDGVRNQKMYLIACDAQATQLLSGLLSRRPGGKNAYN
jgi:hypothetical protein